jgi:hypothetical protein
MADSLNTISMADFDLEDEIRETYCADLVLGEIIETKFGPKGMKRDELGFQVFRLNDQEVRALHYMASALHSHAFHLYEKFNEAIEQVQS